MKKFLALLSLLFLFAFSGCGSGGTGETADGSPTSGVIVPSYFRDKSLWSRLLSVHSSKLFFVVVNPDTGPGEEVDPLFKEVVSSLKKGGKHPIGYIYTSWGKRPREEVKLDVDKWLKLYPDIDGFFFDEVSAQEEDFSYYRELYRYVKSKGSYYVVLNPGTFPEEDYFSIADFVVVLEGSYTLLEGLETGSFRQKSGCIVTGVDSTLWREVVKKAKDKCCLIYVTDKSGVESYESLPDYFEEEVDAVI